MPALLHELLQDIVVEIVSRQNTEIGECKALEKFMLSGSELFNVALNFFQRVVNVTIHKDFFDFAINSWDQTLYIPKDFCFLNLILKCVGEVVPHLIIHHEFVGSINSDICDKLIGENLKTLVLLVPLSKKQQLLLKQRTTVDTIKCECVTTLDDLVMIPPSCRELRIAGIKFNEFLQEMPSNLTLNSVEKLYIDGDLSRFCFNAENIQKCLSFITQNFPSLKLLEVKYFCSFFDYTEMFDSIDTLNSAMFNEFPQHIKGFFHFQTHDHADWADDIVAKYQLIPDFAIDDLFQVIDRRVKVHENFDLNFIITVHPVYEFDEDINFTV
uniref:Uncharacterized protein n=1 Tax=Panagrolaimus davidi TaxID=227884 RepID=A0A914R9B7_9BILA